MSCGSRGGIPCQGPFRQGEARPRSQWPRWQAVADGAAAVRLVRFLGAPFLYYAGTRTADGHASRITGDSGRRRLFLISKSKFHTVQWEGFRRRRPSRYRELGPEIRNTPSAKDTSEKEGESRSTHVRLPVNTISAGL